MKLTNYHRQTFVTAVMNDVPVQDFGDQYDKLIKKDMIDSAHPKIKAVLLDSSISHCLMSGFCSVRPDSINVGNHTYRSYSLGVGAVSTYKGYEPSADAQAIVFGIMVSAVEQKNRIDSLRLKVKGAIEGCTTLKMALERLPEFAKYLPEETAKGTLLPAVANLSADLIKAGWPKGVTPVAIV